MGLSRQEYWSGLSCPPPADHPNQWLNLCLLHYRQILYRTAIAEAFFFFFLEAYLKYIQIISAHGKIVKLQSRL